MSINPIWSITTSLQGGYWPKFWCYVGFSLFGPDGGFKNAPPAIQISIRRCRKCPEIPGGGGKSCFISPPQPFKFYEKLAESLKCFGKLRRERDFLVIFFFRFFFELVFWPSPLPVTNLGFITRIVFMDTATSVIPLNGEPFFRLRGAIPL